MTAAAAGSDVDTGVKLPARLSTPSASSGCELRNQLPRPHQAPPGKRHSLEKGHHDKCRAAQKICDSAYLVTSVMSLSRARRQDFRNHHSPRSSHRKYGPRHSGNLCLQGIFTTAHGRSYARERHAVLLQLSASFASTPPPELHPRRKLQRRQ